jgi:hypothetical protein
MLAGAMDATPSEGMQRADESVATRFSRIMKASTSPLGILTDPPLVAVMTAPVLLALLGALELGAPTALAWAFGVLATLPLAGAIVVTIALSNARERVVAWLARLPFPLDNMNAVLNGVGETLEIRFREAGPTKEALKEPLERVSSDSFVTDVKDDGGLVEVRIGIIDSKRNPAKTNHLRFVRIERLVEDALVPLHATHPIASVRIK